MFPVPAHYFRQKEFLSLRVFFIPQKKRSRSLQSARLSCKSSFFSTVEDGLPFLKKKKLLEGFDLNIAQWHVHEKGLDDISFKCLLSVPNKTVTVTFLGCCSLGYNLLITSQTFVKTVISQKNSVFNEALIHDSKLMKLLTVHLSKRIWSTGILDLEIIYIENSEV